MLPLVYIAAILIGLSFWSTPTNDPDLGWHLLGGAWITEHGSVPSYDFINSLNTSWHDYHWLAQVIFYQIYLLGGYAALRFSFGILMAYLCKVILDIVVISLGETRSALLSTLFFVCSVSILLNVSSVRPQMLAILLVALANRRLLKPQSSSELPFLLGLTVLAANMHVYWIFVPLLWLGYRVLPAKLGQGEIKFRFALLGLGLLGLCGAASPYGLQNYGLIWEYLNIPTLIKNSINEFKNPFSEVGLISYLLLCYLALTARIFKLAQLRERTGPVLLAVAGLVLCFRSAKFMGLFSVVGIPYLVFYGSRALLKYAPRIVDLEGRFSRVVLYPIIIVSTFSAVLNYPFGDQSKDEEARSKTYPLKGCTELAKAKLAPPIGRDHVRILTHFNHGGWCRWQVYLEDPALDYRVTSDGRTQGVSEERFRDSMNVFAAKDGYQKIVTEIAPDAAVFDKNHPLAQIFLLRPEWKNIFKSDMDIDLAFIKQTERSDAR